MAKLSSINKNNRRIKLSNKLFDKRAKLKKIVMDKKISLEERFKAQQKLSKLPRNSAKTRKDPRFSKIKLVERNYYELKWPNWRYDSKSKKCSS